MLSEQSACKHTCLCVGIYVTVFDVCQVYQIFSNSFLAVSLYSVTLEIKKTTENYLQGDRKKENIVHSRDGYLKDVVLDQLFPQHDDAKLNAQLDEAASWRALRETRTSFVHLVIITKYFNIV